MNPYSFPLVARDFMKSIKPLPNGPKFLLLLAVLGTLIICVALNRLPDILRAAPPAIRAIREQPAKTSPEISFKGAEGHEN